MQRNILAAWIFCGVMLDVAVDAKAGVPNTFFYTGPANGDFFDESNWTTEPDGMGSSPVGDPFVDSTTNAISLDLIIDGDAVDAAG